MLLLIMYIFSLALCQAVSGYVLDTPPGQVRDDTWKEIRDYWPGVGLAMLSLFQAITGGNDWANLAEPLKDVGALYYCIFLFYIAFMCFATLNVVMGVFVDQAIACGRLEADLGVEGMKEDIQLRKRLEAIFKSIDTSNDGEITLDEFEDCIKDKKTKAFFDQLDINVENGRELFELWSVVLGHEATGNMNMEDFAKCINSIKGSAKSGDVRLLDQKTERQRLELGLFMEHVDRRLAYFSSCMAVLVSSTKTGQRLIEHDDPSSLMEVFKEKHIQLPHWPREALEDYRAQEPSPRAQERPTAEAESRKKQHQLEFVSDDQQGTCSTCKELTDVNPV